MEFEVPEDATCDFHECSLYYILIWFLTGAGKCAHGDYQPQARFTYHPLKSMSIDYITTTVEEARTTWECKVSGICGLTMRPLRKRRIPWAPDAVTVLY
jgi:hypothetical protein